MDHHKGVATVAKRAPLEYIELETPTPILNEVLMQSEWTSIGPLELHQADGGLLVQHPQLLGDSVSGVIKSIGPDVKDFAVGDHVFGFTMGGKAAKSWQQLVLAPETMIAKLPSNLRADEAVAIPTNFVTAMHTITTELGVALPWPVPAEYKPDNVPFLIWGGSSSVGQYTIQVLKHWGYNNIIVVASSRQHGLLQKLGATKTFDYNDAGIVSQLRSLGNIPYVVDCIGSKDKSLEPLAKVLTAGTKVAIMLPVIIRDASEIEEPSYSMDVEKEAAWAEGVEAIGVRTHFYQKNAFNAEHLQRDIMPALVREGVIVSNKIRQVDGKDMLDSATKALALLRGRQVSGEKLVFRVDQV